LVPVVAQFSHFAIWANFPYIFKVIFLESPRDHPFKNLPIISLIDYGNVLGYSFNDEHSFHGGDPVVDQPLPLAEVDMAIHYKFTLFPERIPFT
jgi:hypothetical protein